MGGSESVVRRLTADDGDLLHYALTWDDDTPRWYREMDAVFNQTPEQLLEKLADRHYWFVGVFDPLLQAVIIVENHGDGSFEGHLMSSRSANVELIQMTITQLLLDLLQFDLREAFVWVAKKHRSIRKLCVSIGIEPDGAVMYKGVYHGRVIHWLRHSITREQLLMTQAA